LIRFIEEENGQKFFRSGGGITASSNLNDEYREALDKIYLPFAPTKPNSLPHSVIEQKDSETIKLSTP
jgi:hypothetical protein